MTRIDQMGRNDAERLIHALIEIDALTDALEDMVEQFAPVIERDDRLHLTAGGLSALEHAFDVLGRDDPYPVPERECDQPDCHKEATCGVPTPDGYRCLCFDHYEQRQRGEIA